MSLHFKNQGLFISLIFHIFLMFIPFSKVAVNDFKEINLVIDERVEETTPSTKNFVAKNEKIIKRESKEESNYINDRDQLKKENEFKKEQDILGAVEKNEYIALANNDKTEIVSNKLITEERSVTTNVTAISNDTNETIKEEEIKEYHFGTINGPKFLKKEIPVYPLISKKLGKEGKVVLMLYINKNGELQKYEIVEHTGIEFAQSAISAIKKSKFLPAVENNIPIDSKALLTIRFKLKGDE